eukprot:11178232-Lingulodinium_polyedra.AAC.1
MRLASRCGCGRSIRPHHRARAQKPYPTTRSNRPSAAATARKPRLNGARTAPASTFPCFAIWNIAEPERGER